MPASTSRTPWSTFSGVIRLIRPSSSSSPQSPHVEPSGRCFQRFVTCIVLVVGSARSAGSAVPGPAAVALYRPVV